MKTKRIGLVLSVAALWWITGEICVQAGDALRPGDQLKPNEKITSPNGQFTLIYQGDGNLVVYGPNSSVMWATYKGSSPGMFTMKGDGNAVVYDASGAAIWANDKSGNPGSYLQMQDDGNLVEYNAQNKPVWASQGGL